MAANETSSAKVQRNFHGLTAALTSAACEWFLIILLLFDAALSYLLTKFARYCKLQIPCILCSRLDRFLGKENPDSYQNLLCSNHRSEISSLLACQIHGKLADGRSMCEDCVLSFITKNKPTHDTNRLFLGKMGFDLCGYGPCGSQPSLPSKNCPPATINTRLCSCCNKSLRSRHNVQRLLQLRLPRNSRSKPNIPLPRRVSRRDNLKKMRDKISATSSSVEKSGCDRMSHVGYTELNINSESESEFPFSDDDDGSRIACGKSELKEEFSLQHASETSCRRLSDDMAPKKISRHSSDTEPPVMKPCTHADVTETCHVKSLVSDVAVGRDLGEGIYQPADEEIFPSSLPELISLDDIPPPSSPADVPVGASPLFQKSNTFVLSGLVSLGDTGPSFNNMEVPVRKSPEKSDVTGASGINEHEEILLISIPAGAGIGDQIINGLAPMDPSDVNQFDVSISAVNIKEGEASDSVTEQPSIEEHDVVDEALKLVLPQKFSSEEIDLLLNKANPNAQDHDGDGSQIADASSSKGIPNLQQSELMDRIDSAAPESLDGCTDGEILGEILVDSLKQQLEHDRGCLNALYKELEEERNAAAIAANEAMAMITRLQEEKAALHMEALQYLRMMDEQAEYDVDALEKANDLLAEKEKEVQDLEAELEYYRLKFPEESMGEAMPEDCCDLKEKNITVVKTSISCMRDDADLPCNLTIPEATKGCDTPIFVNSLWSEFEDEKVYISKRLKVLERKLYQLADNGSSHDASDGGDSEEDGGQNQVEFPDDEGIQTNGQVNENCLSMEHDSTMPDGIHPTKEGLNFPYSRKIVGSKEENHWVSKERNGPTYSGDNKLAALENEVTDLNDRLEALESDCDFLERSFNFLENGKEGLQFVQEIAHQLQELRMLCLRRRCQSVP